MSNFSQTLKEVTELIHSIEDENYLVMLEATKKRFADLSADKAQLMQLQSTIAKEKEVIAKNQGEIPNPLNKLDDGVNAAVAQTQVMLLEERDNEIQILTRQLGLMEQKYDDCVNGIDKPEKRGGCTDLQVKEIINYYGIITQLMTIGNIVLEATKAVDVKLTTEEQETIQTYKSINQGVDEWIAKFRADESILKDCTTKEYNSLIKSGKQYLKISSDLLANLKNLYEDFSGYVRVYVRIKPSSDPSTTSFRLTENQTVSRIDTTPNIVYGPYFSVLDPSFNNLSVYFGENINSESKITRNCSNQLLGICRSARQLEQGYHLVLFASGISGSGKTLTLFGNDKEPGIGEIIITDIVGSTNVIAKIECIMELAFAQVSFLERAGNKGKVINLMGTTKTLNPEVNMPDVTLDNTEHDALLPEMTKKKINPNALKPGDIAKLREILDEYRVKHGRITETTNNPSSSRSHLLIIISVGTGLLTILDSAGFESPLNILDSFWSKPPNKPWFLPSMLVKSPIVSPYIVDKETGRSNLEWRSVDDKRIIGKVTGIIKTGIWISYSLADLKTFFTRQTQIKRDDRVAKFPIQKDNEYNPRDSLQKNVTQKTDSIGMFSLLTTLKNLRSGKDGSRTKFVLINAIRSEAKYADVTSDSLNFSKSISS